MGTWDDGILDNDTGADGLAGLQSSVIEDITGLGAMKPTPISTAKLCGAVGVLLQLSAYDFGLETDEGEAIVAAVKAHATQIAKLPAPAREVMGEVMAGRGKAVAEKPAKVPDAQLPRPRSGPQCMCRPYPTVQSATGYRILASSSTTPNAKPF